MARSGRSFESQSGSSGGSIGQGFKMKRYWDASALVNALHDLKLEAKVLEFDQWTRPHALSEAFSTLTGGRLGFKYAPDDAATLLNEITRGMHFVELDEKDTLAALAL